MYRGKYHLGLQIDIVIKFPMYVLDCSFQVLPYIFASFGNVDSSLLFELEIVFLNDNDTIRRRQIQLDALCCI